ncbi:MAG: hypothetical protein WKF58_17095 [Ilumatobacteraceae bacterium]
MPWRTTHATIPNRACSPRAGDRLLAAADAIAVIRLALHQPLRPETVVVIRDADRRAGTVVVVSGTFSCDAVVTVCEVLSAAVGSDRLAGPSGLVVASVRPDQPMTPDDLDRWLEASRRHRGGRIRARRVVHRHGRCRVATVRVSRDALGEPPRWRT